MNRDSAAVKARTAQKGRWALVAIAPVMAAGLLLNVLVFSGLGRLAPVAFVVGVAICAAVIAVVLLLLRRAELWRPAGAWPLLPLAWGGLACYVFPVVAGDALSTIAAAIGWEDATASLMGAWPEEIGKGLGIALAMLALSKLWNRAWDGVVVGMLVGLGFELVENVQYGLTGALEDANSDFDGMVATWVIRGIAGPGLHVFFSGIAGLGIAVALFGRGLAPARRWLYGVGTPLVGFVLHFLWNYAWPETAGVWVHLVVWPVSIACLILCWRAGKRMSPRDGAAVTGGSPEEPGDAAALTGGAPEGPRGGRRKAKKSPETA